MRASFNPQRCLVVWHRFGKEHGEDTGFRRNSPEIVKKSIEDKIAALGKTEEDRWEWYAVSDEVLVEFPNHRRHSDDSSAFYYLPKRHWTVMDRHYHPGFDPPWRWYVHIGDFQCDIESQTWVFRDLFVDVLIQEDGRTHKVYDLDDLAEVLEKDIIDQPTCGRILRYAQETIDLLLDGGFPPPELADAIDYVENGDGRLLRPKA